jgi:hypothetical protein
MKKSKKKLKFTNICSPSVDNYHGEKRKGELKILSPSQAKTVIETSRKAPQKHRIPLLRRVQPTPF